MLLLLEQLLPGDALDRCQKMFSLILRLLLIFGINILVLKQ